MPWSKVVSAVVVLFVVLGTSGCIDDQKLLARVREYFPGATLYKFDKRVLWIQTNVDGVSDKFAGVTFDNFLEKTEVYTQQKSGGLLNFSNAMAHDGYVFLVLGFRRGIVVWDRRVNLRWTLTWPQARTWFTQYLGYFPEQDQIEIVGRERGNPTSAQPVQNQTQSSWTAPPGMTIIVSLGSSVSSKDATTGQSVACSVAEDVVVGGRIVIPVGSKAGCSVASVNPRTRTPVRLWLKLDSITIDGKEYRVSAKWSGETGERLDRHISYDFGTKLRFTLKSELAVE